MLPNPPLFVLVFCLSAVLNAAAGSGGGPVKPPYDILVLGEEHANPAYQGQIVASAEHLLELGFDKFSIEQPGDVSDEIHRYIRGKHTMDEGSQREAMWNMMSIVTGTPVLPREFTRKKPLPNGEATGTMDMLADLVLAGMEIRLVDVPIDVLRPYLGEDTLKKLDDPTDEDMDALMTGIYRTLGSRNDYMCERLEPGTVVLVGRAHTGKGENTLDSMLRRRGMSVLSVDFTGADQYDHDENDETDADIAVTPEQIEEAGGLDGVVRQMAEKDKQND